ncbi:hypothetical protein QL285_020677 [Trifolium repens]|nr:hypothetical protein QL285_020677 [Trifolium repens]
MPCVSSLRRRGARHGEIIGPVPNSLARRVVTRQGEVHQHEGSSSPWRLALSSPERVYSELVLFCEISKINLLNTCNPHPKACNHTIHIIYDRMERNLGVNSSHTTIFLNPKLTCKVHNFGESN